MSIFVSIIVGTGLISLLPFSGGLFLFFRKQLGDKLSIFLMAFAAGALMGTAFLHLLPEAIEGITSRNAFLFILFGFGIFFVIENILHWHNSHRGDPSHSAL